MQRGRVAALVVCALALSGCARLLYVQQAPRAQLVPEDLHAWSCGLPVVGCTLTGTVHNNGSGCANHIAARVRLFGAQGEQVGKVYSWRLPHQQIVDPKDDVAWRVDFVPLVDAQAMETYDINIEWVTTPCNVGAGWLGRRHIK